MIGRYPCVNHYPLVVRNTFKLDLEKIMHTKLIVFFVSVFLTLEGIRVLISSFDDDNDGDGMAYSTRDSYKFSILEGS